MIQENLTAPKTGQPLPPVPKGLNVPFYYSSLSNCGVFYKVPVEKVIPYLQNTGLAPANFDGMAMVSFNFQLYAGQFDFGASITQEVEFSILVYPKAMESLIPDITFEDYLKGEDQTKLYGNHRVWVPCDNENAIKAGVELYGEPKFKTTFKINLPSLNANPIGTIWSFSTLDPKHPNETIFTCKFETKGLTRYPANFSPITEYGTHGGKMIACRWNILQPLDTYFFEDGTKQVKLDFGNSNHPMKKDMENLIGDTPATAARTLLPPPIAINSGAYYPIKIN
ncbi:MAG: hypothetical protein JKY54_08750 [Flavobacteriales bacterium]|nr:hypothetical protein [Flavobacteriales bacterium]